MGLLDSILGMVTGGQGGQGGGNAALISAVVAMLANSGQGGAGGAAAGGLGGLGGLIGKFEQAGLGDVMSSWVGTGQNQSITPDQVHNTLGPDVIGNLAGQLGMSHGDVSSQLSTMLPQLIDQLTPHGQAPAGGLGSMGDILAQLSKR